MFFGKYNTPLDRLTASSVASKYNIDNNPNQQVIDSLESLILNVYDPIVDHFGYPVKITSCYRSNAVNKKVGGSLTSQHSVGEAIDLDPQADNRGVSNKELFDFIRNNIKFDQLIWEYGNDIEPNWVHVSYKPNGGNRTAILKAVKGKGYVLYDQPKIVYEGLVSV